MQCRNANLRRCWRQERGTAPVEWVALSMVMAAGLAAIALALTRHGTAIGSSIGEVILHCITGAGCGASDAPSPAASLTPIAGLAVPQLALAVPNLGATLIGSSSRSLLAIGGLGLLAGVGAFASLPRLSSLTQLFQGNPIVPFPLPSPVREWLRNAHRFIDWVRGGVQSLIGWIRNAIIPHTRPLTPAEIAAAKSVLGENAIDWERVRIHEGGILAILTAPFGQRPFTLGHHIFVPNPAGMTTATMVHESVHVLQYERGGWWYVLESVVNQARHGSDAYDYGGADGLRRALAEGKTLSDFNVEQQAQIAEDYYERLQRGDDVSMYQPFIDQLRRGEIGSTFERWIINPLRRAWDRAWDWVQDKWNRVRDWIPKLPW